MRRGNGREKTVESHILDVVRYFHIFQYAADERQLYTFLSKKVSKNAFNEALEKLVRQKKLVKGEMSMPPGSIYAMGGHSILLKKRIARKVQTEKKLQNLKRYSHILHTSPWIRMVGISGSCSMDNAKANDDVDFFIITTKNRLWLGRAWAIVVAKLLGVHRSRRDRAVSGKACLNMFFDEQDLIIPESKKNLYIAHEVVQMRLINMPVGAYHHRKFLQSNQWIKAYFPNFRMPKSQKDVGIMLTNQNPLMVILGAVLEPLAKHLQLAIMKPHITKERISNTQLWFFPKDFEKKIAKKI